VVIGGVTGVAGTDYVLDDLGGSVGLLQLLTNPSSNTTISVEAPSATIVPKAVYYRRRRVA
jgi:hypothetical protein